MLKQRDSLEVGRAALLMALTRNREEENKLKQELMDQGFRTTAVDFGGEFLSSISKIIERAVVAAERQNLVENRHVGAGAVAGATQEALEQVKIKALGFNVGGKIGLARCGEHISVAVFMGIGVLNLNELTVGMGHRSLTIDD